jgi:hypothetical protein
MTMRMPWGKFRGLGLGDIPTGYLVRILEEGYTDRTPTLKLAVRTEIAERLELRAAPPSSPRPTNGTPPPELAHLMGQLVGLGYKHLAVRLHPDRGGKTEEMQRLNRLRDWLRGHRWLS